jgi:hypothetical protein
VFIVPMVDPKPSDTLDARTPPPMAYEAPSLVEVGTLRDLTAAGSFVDPT